jgi:uncharacterized protein (TIGR03437 family)
VPADSIITLTDGRGASFTVAPLALAANQVNFAVPGAAAAGVGSLSVSVSGKQVAAGVVRLERVAPGLFTANSDGKGVAAALAVTVTADGRQSTEVVFDQSAAAGARRGLPIDLSQTGSQVYLLLFGTGMRGAVQKAAATVGGVAVPVTGPVAQGQYEGLDQVNLGPLPALLAGRGDVEVALTVDGKAANRVTVNLR